MPFIHPLERSLSFHNLPNSKVISGAPSAEEAIRLADLDWTVGLEPVHQVKFDGSIHAVEGKFLTVRQDTEDVLGVVGKVYAPFQNAEAFTFANSLLGHGVEFDSAGHYDQSRKVFLTAKLPEGISIQGEEEDLDLYLLFKTTHDGSGAIDAMVIPFRPSCTNQFNLALRQAVSRWSARHTRTASERVDEAAKTLGIVDKYRVAFSETASQLLAVEMELAEFSEFVKSVTPAERLQKGMVETFSTSPTVDRKTGWGAVNAVGEYLEHLRGGRGSADSRFESNLTGQTANLRSRAAELLLTRTR